MATKNGEIKADNEVLAKGTKVTRKIPETAKIDVQEAPVYVRPIERINVRKIPEISDASLFEPRRFADKGNRLEVLDKTEDWYYVDVNHEFKGWVMKILVV